MTRSSLAESIKKQHYVGGFRCGVCLSYYPESTEAYIVPIKYLGHIRLLINNHICPQCLVDLPAAQMQMAVNDFVRRIKAVSG